MQEITMDCDLGHVLAGGDITIEDKQNYSNKNYWMFIVSGYDSLFATLDQAIPFALANRKREYAIEKTTDQWAASPHRLSFLDVGCGSGNILLAAYGYTRRKFEKMKIKKDDRRPQMSFAGIEHDVRLAKVAYTARCGQIFNMDAFEFKHYHEYDIIYYYRPIKDTELGVKFEEMIRHKAKPGAIIIPNFAHKSGGMKENDKLIYRCGNRLKGYTSAFQKKFPTSTT